MTETTETRGAVEIITPDESVHERLRAITELAKACKRLASALDQPVQIVTLTGNITAEARYGVQVGKRKPRSA